MHDMLLWRLWRMARTRAIAQDETPDPCGTQFVNEVTSPVPVMPRHGDRLNWASGTQSVPVQWGGQTADERMEGKGRWHLGNAHTSEQWKVET